MAVSVLPMRKKRGESLDTMEMRFHLHEGLEKTLIFLMTLRQMKEAPKR